MAFPSITSRQNSIARFAASLKDSADVRKESGLFLCEGARLCADAARSGISVVRCFFTRGAQEKYGSYLREMLAGGPEAYLVEEHVANLLSSTKASQGVFCVCKQPAGLCFGLPGEDKPLQPLLVLEHLQDPGNLGTVLRTAEALGVHQVVLTGDCCDVLSPKVLRSSMGAVFRARLFVEPEVDKVANRLKAMGCRLLAAVPDSTAQPVTKVDFSAGHFAVFIGNEGSGLTKQAVDCCDGKVTIPMRGQAESLNASAAATILLWEMARSQEADSHG